MRYHALAADYDGTLATHGRIDGATWDALRRLRDSGRKLVMVTRAAVRAAVEKRYTLPADKPSGLVDKAAVSP